MKNQLLRHDPAAVAQAPHAGSCGPWRTLTRAVRKGWAYLRGQFACSRYLYRVIAAEVSATTRFFDRLIQCDALEHDSGVLFDRVRCPVKTVVDSPLDLPDLSGESATRTAVLFNGNLNYHHDIQALLAVMRPKLARTARVVVVAYNAYLRWLYVLASVLRLRTAPLPTTFLTQLHLQKIAELAGYQVVRMRPAGYFPFRLFGLGSLVNRVLPAVPLLRWLGFVAVVTLRPVRPEAKKPSLSVIIPARNERGNIENALKRLPDLGARVEILFVEGHSNDGTWEEIQRVAGLYADCFDIKTYKQTGKGKCDAARLGFDRATGDLVTILDADLTMPPELLSRFYDAYCDGLGDFVNGNRLVYAMEGQAMRFLNRLGNIFFARALSYVLGNRLGDSLCGTKLLARHDYARILAWRERFGDFDPFGDFELLFGASVLTLDVVDVPIRYRARTYGTTNISRFSHGWMLLKMTLIGLFRVTTGRV